MKRRIQFRVGLMAVTVAALWGASFPRPAAAQVPDENRKQLVEALGPPFVVFRERVLDELKVSDSQREKLMEFAMEQVMQTGPFLDALPSSGPEREKKLAEHRKNAAEKLAKNLNEALQWQQVTCRRCGRTYQCTPEDDYLSLIHISEPTRPY